ncbi:uncharacterized protein LOC128883168 [Hylaeus volcanicus]|uniref:uncharacterized protein LOC128883168 n=1 Tax=Hylaeus volcanicus TaxID=313075 RepID=UPI0023B7D72F|nr:uncharacterized protein LOC128883168 [Hylaeus volcanicus]
MSGIFEYNGSAVVAMAGKECVAIACDRRLGSNQLQTVSANFKKVYSVNDKTLIGYAGLATDVQTMQNNLRFRLNLYKLREECDIQPGMLSNLVGTMLYGRRFAPWFVSPVVAGLNEKNEPFLSAFDFIGAACHAKDFVVAGTSCEQLYGVCEAFWRENMNPDELFETVSQCLLAATDRDCLAGWGAYVYIQTPTLRIVKTLKSRMD